LSSHLADNYRPISLTCVASKIFEQIIKDAILRHLSCYNILDPSQHGFVEKSSTCSNLIESLSDWTQNIEKKNSTLVAYVDFQKAFNCVSFAKLVHKLKHIGIAGKLLDCITSFLVGRTQRVKIENTVSDEVTLISGVPQGSVLGPILFIIYVNDIVHGQPAGTISKLYADDLKSYNVIHDLADSAPFIDTLKHIFEWSRLWQLPIALSKCQWMHITTKKKSLDDQSLFLLGCASVHETFQSSDLGVVFSSSLNFHQHIANLCSKAKGLVFFLYKRLVTKNPVYLILAYKLYIVPILSYVSPVWSPSTLCDILKIESIQRTFTKKLQGYEDMSYNERLQKAGLRSLELTRLHADLILCYKILHGLIKINYSQMFDYDSYYGPRSHGLTLRAPRVRTDLGLHSFNYRTVNSWNKLSPNTVWAPTLKQFKTQLYSEDLSHSLVLDFDTF
jgi:hypothetical protein